MHIDYLCQLAHIELNEKEKQIIPKNINQIIEFFNKIQELDIKEEEYYYPSHLGQTKYNQTPKNEIDFEEFINENSKREGNYFKIPPILKT